ncbi:MAG: hypothetical protein ACOYLO_00560 [Ferruginibacter sp.]
MEKDTKKFNYQICKDILKDQLEIGLFSENFLGKVFDITIKQTRVNNLVIKINGESFIYLSQNEVGIAFLEENDFINKLFKINLSNLFMSHNYRLGHNEMVYIIKNLSHDKEMPISKFVIINTDSGNLHVE